MAKWFNDANGSPLVKIAFIINGLLSSKEELAASFTHDKEDLYCEFLTSTYAGNSISSAEECSRAEYDWVVACGGDGTLNEVLNGLMKNPENKSKLALYPLGTGNDFSRSIACTKDPHLLIKSLYQNSSRWVDIGWVEKEKESRYFINVSDAGMGGEITQKIQTSGNSIGKWVYFKTILQTFFTYKRPLVSIRSAEYSAKQKVITIVIGNGISFGGGYKIVYDAKLDDGKFFVAVIGDISILTYLMKIPALMAGKHINHKKIHYFHTKELWIEGHSEEEVYLEMDGEAFKPLPLYMSCKPKAIRFMHIPT